MSQEKGAQEESNDVIIIQEKITKRNGEVTIKKYERGKFLGKGGFANCYEIKECQSDLPISAAKIVAKNSLTKKRALEKLLAEIKIHKSLQHENIVQFEHVFEDKENVYIILELCPNQTLKELLKKRKRLSEQETTVYLVQVLNALRYLHAKKIIHRDLKLGNLLIGKNFDIKVGDFGLAAKMEQDGERRRTICGTPNYIAPEVLDKKQGHSYEVDVWSFGVICYTLLIGRPPFETNDTKATYKRISNGSYTFPNNVPISEDAKDLIKKILVLDPSARPTLDEIFEHPFIKSNAIALNVSQLNETSAVFRNGLTIPVSRDHLPQTLPSERAMIQRTVGSQAFMKDLVTEKDLDEKENDIFVASSLRGIEKASAAHTRIKTFDLKKSEPMMTLRTSSPLLLQSKQTDPQQKFDFGVHVTKWIDYSTKYGFGFLLSDESGGVVFNDLTKLILSCDGQNFHYLSRKPNELQEVLVEYPITNYPAQLQKKFVLAKQIKYYLEGKGAFCLNNENKEQKTFEKVKSSRVKLEPTVYMKKWIKTKNAYLFRLSNKLVQVDFTDKTQIILDQQQSLVYYKNKLGETNQYSLLTALDSDCHEMVKRLKYAKDVLIFEKNENRKVEQPSQNKYLVKAQKSSDFQIMAFPSIDGVTDKLPKMHINAGISHLEDVPMKF